MQKNVWTLNVIWWLCPGGRCTPLLCDDRSRCPWCNPRDNWTNCSYSDLQRLINCENWLLPVPQHRLLILLSWLAGVVYLRLTRLSWPHYHISQNRPTFSSVRLYSSLYLVVRSDFNYINSVNWISRQNDEINHVYKRCHRQGWIFYKIVELCIFLFVKLKM